MTSSHQNNKMQSILFLINADWYFDLHWLNRAYFLKNNGYTIHVATNFVDDRFIKKFSSMGFHCHLVFIKRRSLNPFNDIRTLKDFYKLFRLINPTYIHCVTIKPNIYGGWIAAFLKKKVIFTLPGLGTVFSNKRYYFKIIRFLICFSYKLIAKHTYSYFVFENYDDYNFFITNKIINRVQGVVINGAGVNIKQFSYEPLPEGNTILFASRLLKEKGLIYLLKAVERLKQKGINVTLNVAGFLDKESADAIPETLLEQWHESGLINWLGSCNYMPEQIRNSVLVCLPTTYGEGVPRILIEAASCGRALVATNVNGCREIALDGYNAKLVYPGDVDALSHALENLLSNRNRLIEYGQNGRKLVIDKFSDEIVLAKTLRLYSSFV